MAKTYPLDTEEASVFSMRAMVITMMVDSERRGLYEVQQLEL